MKLLCRRVGLNCVRGRYKGLKARKGLKQKMENEAFAWEGSRKDGGQGTPGDCQSKGKPKMAW